MSTLNQDKVKDLVPARVELFIVDGTNIDSSLLFKFTPSSDTAVGFGSYGTFQPFPIAGTGWQTTTNQPPRPKLTISNISKTIQPYIQQFNDLVQAKVTRIVTYDKYLDSGSSPDDTQHFPISIWYINSLVSHDKSQFVFELVSVLDNPNLKFPPGQCLKDQTGSAHNLYAPGLSTQRYRG